MEGAVGSVRSESVRDFVDAADEKTFNRSTKSLGDMLSSKVTPTCFSSIKRKLIPAAVARAWTASALPATETSRVTVSKNEELIDL